MKYFVNELKFHDVEFIMILLLTKFLTIWNYASHLSSACFITFFEFDQNIWTCINLFLSHFYMVKFSYASILYSYEEKTNSWSLERSEVSKISIMILMARCEFILNRFLIDEGDSGM